MSRQDRQELVDHIVKMFFHVVPAEYRAKQFTHPLQKPCLHLRHLQQGIQRFMAESLDFRVQRFDIVFDRCPVQVPPAGLHVKQQILPFTARHPVYPHVGKVHIAQNDFIGGMRKHVVDVQSFLHPRQIVPVVQILLLAEIAQLKPVPVVTVLQELIRPGPRQDIDIVNVLFVCYSFIGGHKVLVDLFPQIVVSPVPAVDINLDHFMILVQDSLSLGQ